MLIMFITVYNYEIVGIVKFPTISIVNIFFMYKYVFN